jgi:predicted DCC family thiol-disulfide oxidoreductase YuxK
MANQLDRDFRPVVLYDGSCPLCSREIAHYRRRRNAESVCWIDASTDSTSLTRLGIDRADAMSIFHVRDASGNWHTGVAAFVYLWSQLPAYAWLARLVQMLKLTPVLEWGYKYFLKWRSARTCSVDGPCH